MTNVTITIYTLEVVRKTATRKSKIAVFNLFHQGKKEWTFD